MWNSIYEERLAEWCRLRDSVSSLDVDQALMQVNNWWMQAPTVNHHLHWDDVDDWPDPWDLLADNIYCELAKALGIVYTIHMSNHPGITDIRLAQTHDGNNTLVLVNDSTYTLNWAYNELLKNRPVVELISKSLESTEVTKRII